MIVLEEQDDTESILESIRDKSVKYYSEYHSNISDYIEAKRLNRKLRYASVEHILARHRNKF